MRPYRGRFWHFRHFGDIAGIGMFSPPLDAPHFSDVLPAMPGAKPFGVFEPIKAEIIATALEQSGL